ncbi:TPA: ATP-dependent DNA helicase, partial [Pseudomonas aeruginosa]|nr:ATP-dependent DNA helicase [Pseudomonas aeruginosa]
MTEQGGEALYQVAVRALCEFSAKRGDLDLRFTPSPSALEGIAGHTLVTSRRPAHYQREVALDGRYRHLQVRGRADGYDPQANCLEEIKTHRGDLALQPANHRHLHWAQARVYGWLLCAERKLEEVELALVYLEVGSQKETRFVERVRADELRLFFESQCQAFLAWAEQELAHRQRRDRELAALRFPHAEFRHGQRQLAEAVYKAASAGCCLMAQAPTGIGKTIGTLFPQLKAMPGQRLDRLFFLAAKTPGRALALHALRSLEGETGGLPVRVLELVARDKACEHPDKACHGESCPLAQGFYERLPAARAAAVEARWLDQARLREVALAHRVCPYYLGQELARWCDLAVGDYNYYFDLGAMLHGLAQVNQWRVAVLVDEAHNLVERGRRMYSAELDQGDFLGVRKTAPEVLRKPLERIQRAWNELGKTQADDYQAYDEPP